MEKANTDNTTKQNDKPRKTLLKIDKITKYFEDSLAVDEVRLKIKEGEIFALLGSSGSGKSTLLRILAGFEQPTSGKIYLEDQDITDLPPYKRPINMMFQSYALFPHMTAYNNIAFGLRQEQLPKEEIADKVSQLLKLVNMEKYAHRKPHQLSGGQCQRIALARSLAKRPKLVLLDEPLGALDKRLRLRMQLEIVEILEQVGATCLMVTHDQEEAMTMADRIGIMDNGWIVQVGSPIDIYETPNSRMTAEFIGSVNIMKGEITTEEADHVIISSDEIEHPVYIDHGITAALEDRRVWIAIRPEKILLTKEKPDMVHNFAEGIVYDIAYLGAHSVYHIKLNSGKIILCNMANTERTADRATWNEKVYIYWQPESIVVLNS